MPVRLSYVKNVSATPVEVLAYCLAVSGGTVFPWDNNSRVHWSRASCSDLALASDSDRPSD
jgi:hypothetical protein